MTLEQLNSLMAWVTEMAQYEAAQAAHAGDEDWYVSSKPEQDARAKMIEAFGFEMRWTGEAVPIGTNAAYEQEREARHQAMRATVAAEARKKKSAKRKAKP